MSLGEQTTPGGAGPDEAGKLNLPPISDEHMTERLSQAKAYTLILLRATPKYYEPGARAIIWEHGRRNMALEAAGLLTVVCPVADDSELCGIGIFDTTPDEVTRICDQDPAVKAGIFTYEVHPVRGFPGAALPR